MDRASREQALLRPTDAAPWLPSGGALTWITTVSVIVLLVSAISVLLLLIAVLPSVNWVVIQYSFNNGDLTFNTFSAISLSRVVTTSTTTAVTQSLMQVDGQLGTKCAATASVTTALTSLNLIFHVIFIALYIYLKGSLNKSGQRLKKPLLMISGLFLVQIIFQISAAASFVGSACVKKLLITPAANINIAGFNQTASQVSEVYGFEILLNFL
jgi:hypothetical protein